MKKEKPKGNKYDVPFMNINRKTANEIWNQSTPTKKKTKKDK